MTELLTAIILKETGLWFRGEFAGIKDGGIIETPAPESIRKLMPVMEHLANVLPEPPTAPTGRTCWLTRFPDSR